MDPNRLNSPDTCTVGIEVLGHQLQFAQDPNSKHHGTTVWDASMVFVKFLEKNRRRGRFCPSKLKGKRVIELGAGCGVAGFGMALLGCDVVSTDQKEVLPLLRRNVERNTSNIMQMNPNSDSFGSIQVLELDWGNEDDIRAVGSPFDYIIGTDVVYSEQLLKPLLETITALSGPKTTILIGYEVRSTNVHEQMIHMWKEHFDVKIVPKSKMDSVYQHPSIQLYIMEGKPNRERTQSTKVDFVPHEHEIIETEPVGKITGSTDSDFVQRISEIRAVESKHGTDNGDSSKLRDESEDLGPGKVKEESILKKLQEGKLSEWETRRYGSIAARLLRDVKIN